MLKRFYHSLIGKKLVFNVDTDTPEYEPFQNDFCLPSSFLVAVLLVPAPTSGSLMKLTSPEFFPPETVESSIRVSSLLVIVFSGLCIYRRCFPPMNTTSLESLAEVMTCIKRCCDVAHTGNASSQTDYLARRFAPLQADLLQDDPHLDAQVFEHPLLPDGFPNAS